MFLLPSLLLALVLAAAVGGKPARLLDVQLRLSWTLPLALVDQTVLFSGLAAGVPHALQEPLHLASYGLLSAFAVANLRVRALLPVLVGMASNAVAIAANGGYMPVSASAAASLQLSMGDRSNVSEQADRLRLLGDIFALPSEIPLANVFSIGDILIAIGTVAFVVAVSTNGGTDTRASLLRRSV